MVHSPILHPIRPVVWVTQDGINVIDPSAATIELIGEKAFGLASLPEKWTLPFFVISDKLFNDYISEKNFEEMAHKW